MLSAGFDPVLSLHVRHLLCAVTVDHQDGVARTQVTLCRLAAWCHLNITVTHISIRAHPGKEKKERL